MENHHLLSIYDTIFMLTWFLRKLLFNFIDLQIKTLHHMEKFPLFQFYFNWSHSLTALYNICVIPQKFIRNFPCTRQNFHAIFSLVFTRYFDFLYASRGCVILEKSLLLSNSFPVWYSFAKRMQVLHIIKRV